MAKIRVYSSIANTGIVSRELRFKRIWAKKNAYYDIEEDMLSDLMSDPGVEALFKKGYLYIKDADKAQELGADTVGKTYNDEQLKVFLTIKSANDLGEAIKGMSKASRDNMLDMAKQIDIPLDKIEIIKGLMGVDLTSAMNILRQEKLNPKNADGE